MPYCCHTNRGGFAERASMNMRENRGQTSSPELWIHQSHNARFLSWLYAYWFLFQEVLERVLSAADFDGFLVRPSRSVSEAAEAAFGDFCFFGAPVCDRALTEADFEDLPVALMVEVSASNSPKCRIQGFTQNAVSVTPFVVQTLRHVPNVSPTFSQTGEAYPS